ncbi:MAG: geranylgeranylglyceryl/heptaprenylglyceryl phosphate synthase [Candidatus Nanoarchaeia archaeon]|nr:geranylgeranylglyceryl phosphate synthase family protein [Candidatus Haiyanarchaeum thermophilum]MCW1303267.1 geranylgeranylglyceryl phosphate synthase family protein [Candidatus Haiyanarchaeum thermophilum]MCW1304002.1 geranylgeranylglyceryl phosphate synthase family protein [Candidatus Haiyanarchaeum thermophilum]MCW1306426.1 geranylgeranylglyceryl phosphate synthase family protein [Candidatus Haiyanarchaeum thermophilum]MCW1307276.1 geranylgeranylglyceryl phosphate synthase family protein
MSRNKVKNFIRNEVYESTCIFLPLIDPEKVTPKEAFQLLSYARDFGARASLIGGSGFKDESKVEEIIGYCKRMFGKKEFPFIIFPYDASQISRNCDAVLYLQLLNAPTTKFLRDAPLQGIFKVKEYGVEVIPTGYIITNKDSTAAKLASPIVPDELKDKVKLFTSLAQYSALRDDFLYLDGGSGTKQPVEKEVIRAVVNGLKEMEKVRPRDEEVVLFVGGGINDYEKAYIAAQAGADVIVLGTLLEREPEKLEEVVRGIEEGVKKRGLEVIVT